MSVRIIGSVRGSVRFPDHPEAEGRWGLCGGEDVVAARSSFRSVGEAMTWCRRVMDGEIQPRSIDPAEFPHPATAPDWSDAVVRIDAPGFDDLPGPWATYASRSTRCWYEYDEHADRYGAVVRDDGPREAAS